VEICNLQGVIRQSLSFTEAEGRPVLLDVNGNFMAVATDTGLLKVRTRMSCSCGARGMPSCLYARPMPVAPDMTLFPSLSQRIIRTWGPTCDLPSAVI
jgi:hypothetical protein